MNWKYFQLNLLIYIFRVKKISTNIRVVVLFEILKKVKIIDKKLSIFYYNYKNFFDEFIIFIIQTK